MENPETPAICSNVHMHVSYTATEQSRITCLVQLTGFNVAKDNSHTNELVRNHISSDVIRYLSKLFFFHFGYEKHVFSRLYIGTFVSVLGVCRMIH